MRKILVLRGGALGDFIVTLPTLALLRERWPAARIELAGNAVAASLARARGLLDEVHSQHEARWSGLFGGGESELPEEFGRWLASFDLVINYWPDPDGALARHFPRHAHQIFLTAAAMPAQAPAAAHYCAPLRVLGLETKTFSYSLAPIGRESVRDLPLVIHPGSGSPRKNWPMANWLTLIPRLPAPVSLILGEAELDRWMQHLPAPPQQRLGGTPLHLIDRPLEELVAHFVRCRLFLGHDSGISHLAAACGASCVLLFGPTDPAMWAPPAPGVRVLQAGDDLASIPLEQVERAVVAALAGRG